jgi:hypothetical protein
MMEITIEGLLLGEARQLGTFPRGTWKSFYTCEDGWVVYRSTAPALSGKHEGKYVVAAYKPVGKGARGGRKTAQEWTMVYDRGFRLRRQAKDRAVSIWREHSPKWDARHPALEEEK